MKRILFMHQASTIGGGSYCLLNIINVINRKLFVPIVVLKSEGPLSDILRAEGVEVYIFPQMTGVPYNMPLCNLHSILSYLKAYKSIGAFKTLLNNTKADVLYLNNMMIYPYLRTAKECGCNTVLHVREHWPLDEHQVQFGWIKNAVYKYVDRLIAINHYSANMFPEKKASIVYDWIDMKNRYRPMPMSEIFGEDMKGKKVLLYTGGTMSIKGGDYILKAFREKVKGDEYRLLMLGCQSFLDVGLKDRIKMMLRPLGYHYRGWELQQIADNDKRIRCIPGVYELCDLIKQSYCFVSYFRIPHANLALAENIILGNACIAADTEEAREYSGNGKYAMLVEPNNLIKFKESLNSFLSNVEKWREASNQGAEAISKLFDKNTNSDRLNGVLLTFV